MGEKEGRIVRAGRTLASLGLAAFLAWVSTVVINGIYGLGGRREARQRLNPALVQIHTPIPADARPYLSFKSENISGEIVLSLQNGTLKLEGNRRLKASDSEFKFLGTIDKYQAYDLFIQPIVGRGFITVLQNPNGDNGYTGKIKIDDPYFSQAEYQFQVWIKKIDG